MTEEKIPPPPEPPPTRLYNAFGVLLNQKEIEIWRKNNEEVLRKNT